MKVLIQTTTGSGTFIIKNWEEDVSTMGRMFQIRTDTGNIYLFPIERIVQVSITKETKIESN